MIYMIKTISQNSKIFQERAKTEEVVLTEMNALYKDSFIESRIETSILSNPFLSSKKTSRKDPGN